MSRFRCSLSSIETSDDTLRGSDLHKPLGRGLWSVITEFLDKHYEGQPATGKILAIDSSLRVPFSPANSSHMEWIELFKSLPQQALIDWPMQVVRKERAILCKYHLESTTPEDDLHELIDEVYEDDLSTQSLWPTGPIELVGLHNRSPLVVRDLVNVDLLSPRQNVLLERLISYSNVHYQTHEKHFTELCSILYIQHLIHEYTCLLGEMASVEPDLVLVEEHDETAL